MDCKLSVFADCQNDCVRISVDTINMKINNNNKSNKNKNNLKSLENVIRTCSKWRQIYSRKRTKSL